MNSDQDSTVYHETRQSLLEGLISLGEVTEDELSQMSSEEQNIFLTQAQHDHDDDGCSYCNNLIELGLLEDREYD